MSVSPESTGHLSVSSVAGSVPRTDARRNRDRILAAARQQLAEPGPLRLNAVARASGVGQGTLYRHFPTREDLLAAVYQRDVDDLVAAAPELLAQHTPLKALAAWFDRVSAYARVKRDVFTALEAATWRDLADHSLSPIGGAVELLLAAGRANGSIRDDIEARDVIILITWLSRLDNDELDARGPRLLSVLVDGVRAPHSWDDRRPRHP